MKKIETNEFNDLNCEDNSNYEFKNSFFIYLDRILIDNFYLNFKEHRKHKSYKVILSIIFSKLPYDCDNCEFTDGFLFKTSVLVNFILHGKPSMTLSCRMYIENNRNRAALVRFFWFFAMIGVDFACKILRSEQNHCYNAYINYRNRIRRCVKNGK